ncbi:hypothetical protein OQX61_02060 [Pedobacter sp. PLR]|uniref:hypothetical protein n=1 Tax=Pedobacter sp. PLR TaxID=2994465 RepID=UPI0022453170|nr:hypothetical protein [Pedobacter sp. PLR]MCX2450043.1 hypothetical protein [Pedobacter sp. PLR]
MVLRNKGYWMLVVLMFSFSAKGQTFAEFFKQKKTQKLYLLQQITALQVYAGYAKKGYEIVGSGLGVVQNFTGGEFRLHTALISSLKQVSPSVRAHVKIEELTALLRSMDQAFDGIPMGDLSAGNRVYVLEVKAQVMDQCRSDLDELITIMTSGKLEMSDDERIFRVQRIRQSLGEKYAFVLDFSKQVWLVIQGNKEEQESIHHLRKSYELN